MGKFGFLLLVVTAAMCAYGQNPAPLASLPPQPPVDPREEKLALKAKAREVRDEARRGHNILIGLGPFFSMEAPAYRAPNTNLVSDGLGISLGYRTHIREKTGLKGEAKFQIGETHLSLTRDSLGRAPAGYEDSTSYFAGSKGQVILADAVASLVLGPFGRITLDPGIGFTWGWHTADSVRVTGDAGDFQVPVERRFTAITESFSGNLLLGARDQYILSAGETIGFKLGSHDDVIIQFRLGLTYAFQFPKS